MQKSNFTTIINNFNPYLTDKIDNSLKDNSLSFQKNSLMAKSGFSNHHNDNHKLHHQTCEASNTGFKLKNDLLRPKVTSGSLRGFTLVEILLALLIFTIIIGSLYFSIYVGLKSIERGKVNFEIFQELRICLREIQRDLRSLFYEASTELETLEGDKSSLSIICYKTGGLYKVNYFLEDDGFFRSLEKVLFVQSADNEGAIKFSDARTYQLSSLIKTIDFEYLDENSLWQADWHLNGQYPKAVRITLTFLDAEGLAHEFQSVVSIPIGRRTLVVKSEE